MNRMVVFALLLLPAFVSAQVDPINNAAPAQVLSGYAAYELKPVTVAAEYAGNETAEKVRVKVEENLQAKLKPLLASWQEMHGGSGKQGTLVFEPQVKEVRFISGAKRFWAGAMAGGSHLVVQLRITEAETGKLIAEPEFYQRAGSMAGAFTMGAKDNLMMVHVADAAVNYAKANYEAAVGGPTGREKN
jgi:hypothetical protein